MCPVVVELEGKGSGLEWYNSTVNLASSLAENLAYLSGVLTGLGVGTDNLVRSLPENLNYLPWVLTGLGVGFVATIAASLLGLYVHSKLSNKNLFLFMLIKPCSILILVITGLLNSFLKMIGIKILENFLLNRIKSVFSKLTDEKLNLVNNLEYMVNKISDVSNDYKISSSQANGLIHDEEFKKRFDQAKLNIRNVKILTASFLLYKYAFLISLKCHESIFIYQQYITSMTPMLHNENIKNALSNFRELYNDFNNPSISRFSAHIGPLPNLIHNSFVREQLYINFVNCIEVGI